jgi:thiol-disulfide isomerase/thioredoxin
VVSGKIANSNGELTINSMDRSFKETIEVAEDGSFADTLRIDAGTYMLSQGRNFAQLHIEDGANINVNFDASDFKNTLTISGEGSEISNYLLAKGKKERELMGQGVAFYQLEEAAYKEKANKIKSALISMIDSTQGVAEDYKEKEKRNINYAYLSRLDRFELYHGYYAKKKDFKVSEGFLSELDELDFSNEEDYKFSQAYKGMVSSHYMKQVNEKVKADSTLNRDEVTMQVYKSIPNETIKNDLAFNAAKFGITYTDDVESYYQAFMAVSTNEENNKEITEAYNKLKLVAKGQPSPKFVNYENHAGGTTSLDDLKGKYVYIDVWATWCGPCKAEIPFLKKVEKDYHGKNIEFVSMSIDTEDAYETWKKMVTDEELGGVQILADNAWESKFVTDYMIKGIPRFILIDPDGNIVTPNAPRPSNDDLRKLFDELNI